MRRRRFQLQLSGLFVLIALWCAIAAVWHYRVRRVREDHQNLQKLQQYGVYARSRSDRIWALDFEPVTGQARLGDADVRLLTLFPNAWAVDLRHTNVTDQGIDALFEMSQLRWLYLPKAQVSDAKVAELKQRIPGVVVIHE